MKTPRSLGSCLRALYMTESGLTSRVELVNTAESR
jgi:hypothetical protein